MVSEGGRVFYRLNYSSANNLLPDDYGGEQITIPASEIIHDRMNPFHHQLIGVPPLCAAAIAAGKNIRDRKRTRLNSSHVATSFAAFCLNKKNKMIKLK